MRTSQQRIEKYQARATAALLGPAYSAMVVIMEANYAAHANEITPLQIATKLVLDTQGVAVSDYFGYYGFCNEMFRATKNFAGEALAVESWTLISKYTGMGLSCTILTMIRTDVFTVGDPVSPPDSFGVPQLKTPLDGAVEVALTSDLEWYPVVGAASYDVYLDIIDPPVALLGNVLQSDPLAVLTLSTGVLPATTEHFWHVVAKSACDQEGTSDSRSFTTAAI